VIPRRAFVGTVVGGVVATTLVAAAQQAGKVYTVGILTLGTLGPAHFDWWRPFLDALRELNYVEGRNLVLKHMAAAGRPERLAGLAGDLVRANVDVIVTTSVRETRAAKQATSRIPIIVTIAADPVGQGLVESLARPGGNVTGVTNLVPGLRQKHVELLKEVVPSAVRFGVIASPLGLAPQTLSELEAAAKVLGVSLALVPVHGPDEFDAALARARKDGVTGLIATADAVTLQHRRALVPLVLKHRLPAIYWSREYVEVGGLMTYSADVVALLRRAAIYVDKVLKGAKPADLPVEQPTKFGLVLNKRAAKALGLTIPPTILLRADQVIE
jgi:putative ABC transport system substrate-binding protein